MTGEVRKDPARAKRAEKIMDSCECSKSMAVEMAVRVEAGDIRTAGVSAWVCADPLHLAAAIEWAETSMGLPARLIYPDADR